VRVWSLNTGTQMGQRRYDCLATLASPSRGAIKKANKTFDSYGVSYKKEYCITTTT